MSIFYLLRDDFYGWEVAAAAAISSLLEFHTAGKSQRNQISVGQDKHLKPVYDTVFSKSATLWQDHGTTYWKQIAQAIARSEGFYVMWYKTQNDIPRLILHY